MLTSGEVGLPLGMAWLGTGEARAGGAEAGIPPGMPDIEPFAVAGRELVVDDVMLTLRIERSAEPGRTLRATEAVPMTPESTGLGSEARLLRLLWAMRIDMARTISCQPNAT